MPTATNAALGLALLCLGSAVAATSAAQEAPTGRWESLSCEMRPGPSYLTRDIAIADDGTWSGTFRYFLDDLCLVPTMIFEGGGPFEDVGASRIEGARAMNFVIATAAIEVVEENTAGWLNSADPCGAEEWSVGLTQVVTDTGCAPIGMAFPVTEHEIVLMRGDDLFFGARPLDGSGLPTAESRPTTLQVPMVRAD